MLFVITCTSPAFWMMRAYSGDLVSWYFKHIHSLWPVSEIAKSESVLHSTTVIVLMKLVNGTCSYIKAIAGEKSGFHNFVSSCL
jgi:hypothetical protein